MKVSPTERQAAARSGNRAGADARYCNIQIRLDDFSLDETISADETAIMYRQQPLNQYVPTTAERAVAERAAAHILCASSESSLEL